MKFFMLLISTAICPGIVTSLVEADWQREIRIIDTVWGGYTKNAVDEWDQIYVCRIIYKNKIVPGYVFRHSNDDCCLVDGEEKCHHEGLQYLASYNDEWVETLAAVAIKNTVIGGYSRIGRCRSDILLICRATVEDFSGDLHTIVGHYDWDKEACKVWIRVKGIQGFVFQEMFEILTQDLTGNANCASY